MLVWIDIETTGLNPGHHVILEVACVITDDQLDSLQEYTHLVIDCEPTVLLPSKGDDEVRPNAIYAEHFNNGLIAELTQAYSAKGWQEQSTPEAVGQALHDFIQLHCPEPAPLAGSSVHFDRSFLAEHMPGVLDVLHYRNVDVSTVRELAKRWRPDMAMPERVGKHRALDDIYESIRLLRYFRKEGFIG